MSGFLSTRPPSVNIIVLNWNGWRDTLECLASLQLLDYPNYRVLVVDNGSTDESAPRIRSAYSYSELIEANANLGFAGGNNVGIRRALDNGADYIMLVNNDTTVASTMLTQLIGAIEKSPQTAFVGPKTYYMNDPKRIWFYGARIDEQTGVAIHTPVNMLDTPSYEADHETAYCPGSGLLMRADVLRQIGLLDPRFFVIHEDADWCLRASRFGYSGLVVGKAHMWHKVSASFNRSAVTPGRYYFVRNGLLLNSRHALPHRWRRSLVFAWTFAFREPLRTTRQKREVTLNDFLYPLAGLFAYALGAYGPAPQWISNRGRKRHTAT